MQAKLQCAIYTRVSTDNQAEVEFNSCEAQEAKIKSFIDSQENMEIFRVYSDPGFTGANIDRPALQAILEDVKQKKINLVIAYKIDRLTRSPRDFYQLIELFDKNNVDFISVTERFDTSTPTGRLLRNIMLTFAQFERELTSERIKDKMLERAKKGLHNGGTTPYGYMRQNKKIIPHPQEKENARIMFETYIKTGSLSETYRKLKIKDIKYRSGKNFSKTRIAHILRNIVYIGKIKYGNEIYQGIHESIISEEIFNIAQEIHKKRIRKVRLYKNFLLAGLVKCKECGLHMTPTYTNQKKK